MNIVFIMPELKIGHLEMLMKGKWTYFFLMTYSIHFYYGYTVSDMNIIWEEYDFLLGCVLITKTNKK